MKYCYLIMFLFLQQLSFSQVNYNDIKQKTSDQNSNYFYPSLLERFKNSDSTLTPEDFHAIYYGAVFINSYDPVTITEAEERIRTLNFEQKYIEAYELADSLIKEYPASVQSYFEKSFACYNLKRFEEESYNRKRYKVLIKTILNTGDGKSFSTAWHANLPNDEFEVLKYLDFEIKEESEVSFGEDIFDHFSLKSGKLKQKEAFFNVTRQSR